MKTLLLALLLGLTACASEQVQRTEQKPNVDFRAYKTYNFMDVTARNGAAFQGLGTGIETLKQAISHEMQRRGYQQSDSPDLLVNIGVVTQDKVQTRETTLRDAPLYIGQRNYHWQSQDVVVGHYEEGTATVEVVDAAHQELIWQGAVKSILTPNAAKLTKRIDDAVAALFEKYPVPPVR
ncbi:DUF4136 domain-containing protein [Hymenobacter sp. DH14]|uniref:DUF4136 domain-containing protein n=1 Tax=Hymenobacter cyanobacteriorum TaxID=2926463 RepID=A0A9X1VEM8_9BACT|nr:DUF4136 domain-containing protein [Hymenobacter cyanobacteriorum]MCI1187516.1 DUF4136 domain-containing protein [Hymenobacter cyanobacteriorum]